MQCYIGSILTILPNERNGFIDLDSVMAEDGSAHDLQTWQDIYVHQDDCVSPIRQGMQVIFKVRADARRGGNSLRAVDVKPYFSHELVLVRDDSGGSRAITDPRSLYVPPTPAQRKMMKPITPEAVEQVVANRPMALVPRLAGCNTQDAAEITRRLMQRLFPQFAAINYDGVDMADECFDAVIKKAIDDHESLGMQDQATHMLGQANVYKGLRTLLRSEEDLLKPETLIPIHYLPDLFMAVPVWYFWADTRTQRESMEIKRSSDPEVHPNLQYMCSLVPTDRWSDTFLMYNRRMRTLNEYKGDLIPPRIVARIRKMISFFDYTVIMTPYHDVAGQDWQDVQWLRSIDPYVVGFLRNIPLMFVIGRFSDSGTFPLYSELVADTIAFLRANIEKLRGFDDADQPFWYRQGNPNGYLSGKLGTRLITHTRELLAAFDRGNLFDWLRGDEGNLPVRTPESY